MVVNPSKSAHIIIGTKSHLNINIGDNIINEANEIKILGIVVDRTLCFGTHINYIFKKVSYDNHIIKLRLHNRAARILTFSNWDIELISIFKNLNWFTFDQQLKLEALCTIKRNIRNNHFF